VFHAYALSIFARVQVLPADCYTIYETRVSGQVIKLVDSLKKTELKKLQERFICSFTCILHVSCMYLACILHVSCICDLFGVLHVSCMYIACILRVSCMYLACILHVYCMYLACILHVSCVFAFALYLQFCMYLT
jgi:hypothetical protein